MPDTPNPKPDPWYANRPNEARQPPVTIPLSLARALEDRCWATGENEWAAFMNKAIEAAGHTPVGLMPPDAPPTRDAMLTAASTLLTSCSALRGSIACYSQGTHPNDVANTADLRQKLEAYETVAEWLLRQAGPPKPTPEEDALTKAFADEPHILDFKKAWAIQRARGNKLMHQPRCSSVPGWDTLSGPALMCDCGAVIAEWERIRGKLP